MAKTYLEAAEIRELEQAAGCMRDRLLIRLLFHLGCRVSEALYLQVDDVDFTQGTVTIKHLKSRSKLLCTECGVRIGRRDVFCPRCGIKVEEVITQQQGQRRIRTLPVDQETLELLSDYVKRGGPVTRNGKQLVFGINRHRGWQIIKECADKAGLGKVVNPETGKVHNVSPHRLRDAFAVMAVKRDDSTDSVRMLQEQLGHASIATTMRYRKVAGHELREWYQKLWEKPGDA